MTVDLTSRFGCLHIRLIHVYLTSICHLGIHRSGHTIIVSFFIDCMSLFQGVVIQLSEQISTLNERMDEFTSRIEELNSKIATRKVSASQQNLALQAEAFNASAPTTVFVSSMSNGQLLPNSSSSNQLAREAPFMEEVPI